MKPKHTIAMLVFVAVFYSFLFISQKAAEKNPVLKPKVESVRSLEKKGLEEIRKREEVFKKNILARPGLYGTISLVFFLVLTFGLILNFMLFMRKSRGLPFLQQSVEHRAVPWGLADLVSVFVFLFFSEAVILIVEGTVVFGLHLEYLEKDLFLMINSLLRDIATALFVLYLVRRRWNVPPSEIGLSLQGFWGNLRKGLLGYAALVPSLLLVMFSVALVSQAFSYEPPPQAVVQIYMRESQQKLLIFFTVFVAVLGPVFEEVFFRGFAYATLRTRFGVGAAMAGSAALFALLHMNFVAFLPIFVLGLFFAYLYEKTGSLIPSISVHVLHNLLMVMLTLGFKSLSG